ncbi:hypothetical protein HCN51_47350 [Nonomuraea sp. FMUSA5-5]|uniref:LysR substrate-binding domain-containing protein n=1 Tax=Nonomuraea composti TaxID=2720023 RepID=A0ABX1BJ43_9ACTN|nr:hypothetical protein [Nonomuraea sp. FMUSA5-5]NJP96962.1 hypothetical protein [Nonomuraea sp. FMUSA5-5]
MAELIALGRMVAVLPESVARNLGRGLAAVPLDGRRTTLLAVWREERRDRALAALVRTAAEVAMPFRTATEVAVTRSASAASAAGSAGSAGSGVVGRAVTS